MNENLLRYALLIVFIIVVVVFIIKESSGKEEHSEKVNSLFPKSLIMQDKNKRHHGKNNLSVNYNIYIYAPKEKALIILKSAFVLYIAAFIFYQNIFLALLFSGLSVFSPKLFEKSLIEKRKAELNLQFKDALYSLSSLIAAGKQMPQAIKETEKNLRLIYQEKAYIIKEFNYMIKRIEETNESVEDILLDFALRTGIEDIINFADIYIACRTTGGDLESVINKTSQVILEKINIRQEIDTIMAQKKYEALILTAMPFIIILFLTFISPGYLDRMYTTLSGRLIMTIGLTAIGAAYLWGQKITDIEV
ncbi:MAG: pilus assembly protein TadB [Clostridiales bacterium]|nr:pilus assembly protein TadB [Clostridiales bacterium]